MSSFHPRLGMPADTKFIPPPQRRWAVRILLTLCSLALLLWAAPMIAAWTPLVSWACNRATIFFDGSVYVGGASLG